MRLRSFLFIIAFACLQLSAKDFVWYNGQQPITYSTTNSAAKVVCVALEMFADDMKQVTGSLPELTTINNATIRIIQLNDEAVTKAEKQELQKMGVPVAELTNKKDAFFLAVLGQDAQKQLYVVGSDNRGTAYGILELSRKAGVSPWVWWGDVTPKRKDRLSIPANFTTLQSPSVEYRGIFLNDEDWSLQPWSWKHFEPKDVTGMIGPKTYKMIFQFLLRMRANTIWPAMNGITVPFYFTPDAKEMADNCGIVIGTSHCEPMSRSNPGEWLDVIYGRYNYVTNRKRVLEYWSKRFSDLREIEHITTIGMRGKNDSPMEGTENMTLNEKTRVLDSVIKEQREMIQKYQSKELTQVFQQFVPYKEVLDIMENSLNLPEDIMLTWCDDSYGYITRLSDTEQQKRSGGAGVFYHLNYLGRPHDYTWFCATQPGLIFNEMKEAYKHNAHKQWIVSTHDLKSAAYDLELFLDMAWDINLVSALTLNKHHEEWLCREFGEAAGKKLLPAMLEYYRLCAIRKTEFMGWNQVELDEAKYAKGWSPVQDTEFSLNEFGSELDRYLQDYEVVKQTLLEAEALIPADRKDAFFGQIKYAVFGAAAMAKKMLEAQRARSIAAALPENEWNKNTALLAASAKSQQAYQEILSLTNYYNNEMAGGKWRYFMCHNPHNLYVFDPAKLPIKPTDADILKYASWANKKVASLEELKLDQCIVRNAAAYSKSTKGVSKVENLGHSMSAVSLPKGASITFGFSSPWEGDAVLRTAVIPTQPKNKGDIRFSIQIDNEEPKVVSFFEKEGTETWKINVLRGQARKETQHTLKKGKHKLTITALDDHVLIDQWMIDFKPSRKFYVFPVKAAY